MCHLEEALYVQYIYMYGTVYINALVGASGWHKWEMQQLSTVLVYRTYKYSSRHCYEERNGDNLLSPQHNYNYFSA